MFFTPSDTIISDDWEKYVKDSEYCKDKVEFLDFKILGKSVTNNTCDVLIEVTTKGIYYKYRGAYSHHPCGGLDEKQGNVQTVQRKALFKKYDTGWVREDKYWNLVEKKIIATNKSTCG